MAYAAVIPLVQTLYQYSNPNACIILDNNDQFEALCGKIRFLQAFLEYSMSRCGMIKNLEGKIRNVAYKAQDVNEGLVSDNSGCCQLINICAKKYGIEDGILQLIGENDSIKRNANAVPEAGDDFVPLPDRRYPVMVSDEHNLSQEEVLIGLDADKH